MRIFDEFGNELGPIAGNPGCLIVFIIFFVPMLVVYYICYAIFSLIAYTIQEARKGKWTLAILLECVISGCIASVFFLIVGSSVNTPQVGTPTFQESANATATKIKLCTPDNSTITKRIVHGITTRPESGFYLVGPTKEGEIVHVYLCKNIRIDAGVLALGEYFPLLDNTYANGWNHIQTSLGDFWVTYNPN